MKKHYFMFALTLVFNVSAINAQNLQSGLVAHFPLDGNADDISILNIDGTLAGPTGTNGVLGQAQTALHFSALQTDSLTAGTSDRGITNQFSVSVWVKTTTTETDHLITKYNWTADRGYFLDIYLNKATLAGRDGSNTFRVVQGTTSINDGNWHHIVGTCNGNTWAVYVDCVLEGTLTTNAVNPNFTNSKPLSIGYYFEGDAGDNRFYDGDMDDVRIYNRVLTTQEISMLCDQNLLSNNELTTTNNFTISTIDPSGMWDLKWSTTDNYSIDIYNLNGQLVFNSKTQGTIDLTAQTVGVYLLSIKNKDNEVVYQHKLSKF